MERGARNEVFVDKEKEKEMMMMKLNKKNTITLYLYKNSLCFGRRIFPRKHVSIW